MADKQATREDNHALDAEKTRKEGMNMATTKTTTAKKTTAARTSAAGTAAAKKTTVKKTAAKKAAPAEVQVTLQWNGNEYTSERLLQSAKDVWTFDLGKDAAEFKSAQIYVKPEEGRAYAVVNGSENLFFAI